MKTGKIKFYNTEKAYGFLADDQTRDELFFHISDADPGYIPQQNDMISYEVGENRKGLCAVDLKLLIR